MRAHRSRPGVGDGSPPARGPKGSAASGTGAAQPVGNVVSAPAPAAAPSGVKNLRRSIAIPPVGPTRATLQRSSMSRRAGDGYAPGLMIDIYDPAYTGGPPHELFEELRRTDPVHRQEMPDGTAYWAVLRHADVVEVSGTRTSTPLPGVAWCSRTWTRTRSR